MYADPTGHSIITALIIGAIIGAVIGFGATALKDYTNDKKIFNGDVSFGTYLGHTLGGGIAGLGTGACSFLGVAVGYAALTGTTYTLCGIAMTEGLALATGASFAFITGGAGYAVRVAFDEQETFELSDMLIESFANACSGICSFFAGYDSAIYGWKTPTGKTNLKNQAMSFGVSVVFGYLPMKGVISFLKSIFKEWY